MTDNPFASFAAVPAASLRGGGGDGGGGWMTSRKVGKDDAAIKQAKAKAAESRKAKNRRGPAKKAAGGKKKKRKKNPWSDESEEEEFDAFSEEEDDDGDFVVHSDEEDGGGESDDEGEWGPDMEDDDSDFGGKKKGKKKKSVGLSRSARAGRRAQAKATWRAPPSDDEEEDEIEESPAPPPRERRGKTAGKKKVESPMSVESGSSADDIFASGKKGPRVTKGDGTGVVDLAGSDTEMDTPMPQKRTKQSKYFASDFGEEKKDGEDADDENLLNGASRNKAGKKRKVLDSEDEDDDGFDGAKGSNAAGESPNPLDDTPFKAPGTTGSLNPSLDDYADDDEARALEHAMKESMKDQKGDRKRLKKGGKGGRAKKGASSSSLEAIKQASPAKERPVYKDDLEELQDSDDDVIDVDEAEEYEAVDEEEQTAAQVLAEANALSAKIVKIVSGWCGRLEKGDNVKGLILGETEGALNLGGGGGGDGEKKDEAWISNEAMKELLPAVTLAEYQLLGVNWMALLNRTTFGTGKKGGGPVNGILADEMGLGKTVQTIAFLAWLNHQKGADGAATKRRPHLIVVPASVLSNWMNEFQKFAPEMKVVKYHGSLAERSEIRSEFDLRYLRGKEPLDAVLTTFSYFSSDNNKQDRSFLRRFDFDYLVCDEGHTLKNAKGLRYRNLNKFKTDHRLLLTGTPVQNSPKELMSLLTFLMPLFDRKAKSSKYDGEDDDDDGGERMLEYFVQLETDGSGSDANANAYRKLKQLFAPFVLRRKKDDVLSQLIPPKTRKVDIVPMDEAMRAAYDAILASHVKARAEKGSGAASASESKHLFTELRKSANHPLLLRNRFKSDEERHDLALRAMDYGWFGNDASCTLQLVKDELDKHSDYEIHCAAIQMIEDNPARRKFLETYTLMENDLFCSPKFKRLRTLLPELIGKGHRILIFSQWTKILDLMQHLLHALDMSFLRLDGSTAVSERQDLIDTFNTDSSIPIFLLSTRAGGMGLNLTAADVAILHDLDFNPFNDRQAEDRCHRIGQKKPVTIIKLVTQGTVDEDIYSIQERKARMNEAIMEEGGGSAKNGNDEMCRLANAAVERFLKSPKRPATSTTSSSTAASSPEDACKTDHLPRQNGGEEKDDSNADPSIPPESDGGEEKQPTETADTKSDESKPKKPQSSICWSSDEDSDEEKQLMKTSADAKSNVGKLEPKSKAATKPISGWGSDDDDSDEDDIATMRKKMVVRLAEERKAQR